VSSRPPVTPDSWQSLRELTAARIALGRAGGSLPTSAHLAFQLAHARARDAVARALNAEELEARLTGGGHQVIRVTSAAQDHRQYLERPDLGRQLDPASRQALERSAAAGREWDAVFVVGDGLSAVAVERHAPALLDAVTTSLEQDRWLLAPVVVAERARVALGDEIGHLLGAKMVAVLIGERPGLSSADSLGVYLTYRPCPGMTDAERNCISNIRNAGLSYEVAAHKLHYLMREARRQRLTGLGLKEDAPPLPASGPLTPILERTGHDRS
jgi:ethanolamine ammonia-lyase small subunit